MPSSRRGLRRVLAVGAVTASVLAVGVSPAEARTCWTTVGAGPIFAGPFYYPCPGPQDQPVPAPVWLTTQAGPGFYNADWDFIKVQEGSHVFFANTLVGTPERVHGDGFDSGVVEAPGAAEIVGVASLPVGKYYLYDINNIPEGWLIIEPPYNPCPDCT